MFCACYVHYFVSLRAVRDEVLIHALCCSLDLSQIALHGLDLYLSDEVRVAFGCMSEANIMF